MTLNFRTAIAVLALALTPLAATAQQDDGRAYDEQIAEQITEACGGGDDAGCIAALAQVPANSPLQEDALTAAVNSGMSDAQLVNVVAAARITPAQAARVQTAATNRRRTSAALIAAIRTAPGTQTGNPNPTVDNVDGPNDADISGNQSGGVNDEDDDDNEAFQEEEGSPA